MKEQESVDRPLSHASLSTSLDSVRDIPPPPPPASSSKQRIPVHFPRPSTLSKASRSSMVESNERDTSDHPVVNYTRFSARTNNATRSESYWNKQRALREENLLFTAPYSQPQFRSTSKHPLPLSVDRREHSRVPPLSSRHRIIIHARSASVEQQQPSTRNASTKKRFFNMFRLMI